jgi:hypothetical protein
MRNSQWLCGPLILILRMSNHGLQRGIPMNTPWGKSDSVTELGAGIQFVTTAGHGGYYVPPALNSLVPMAWRDASFNAQGRFGWYEEDCDWSMVALTFPTIFPPAAIDAAKRMYAAYIAPKLGAAAGEFVR